ncbi:hypothetical protein [Cellulomonas sp.]|uniref:hypothetical protein n=1 Tax=Cellulomonas sp. TaxID=40001 RepID=UPI002810C5EA|nr:hypothetical protein [Cellulomonas sp.]
MSRDGAGAGGAEQDPAETEGAGPGSTLAAELDDTDGAAEDPQGPKGDDTTFDRSGAPIPPEGGGRRDQQGDDPEMAPDQSVGDA